MNRFRKIRILLTLFLIGIIGLSLLMAKVTRSAAANNPSSPQPTSADSMPALQGDKAIEHLKQQGTYNSLQEAVGAAKYQATWQASPQLAGLAGAYELQNAANNLLAYISADGLQATSLGDKQRSWRFGLRLIDYEYGNQLSAISSGEITAKENRVEINHNSRLQTPDSRLTEWFVNTARGIEHGFTISAAPAERKAGERLRLRLAVSGDLQAQVDSTQQIATFSRAADNVLLSYDKLFVKDAKGRSLTAAMKTEGSDLLLEVDDATAEYPLTIDPLLRQLQKVTAADGAANDNFGYSVAISGDTAVIGAVQDAIGANTQQGSAYVFIRNGTTWTQQAKLIASDGAANDQFGYKVAISGDTVVVSAIQDAIGANLNQGSAYIFQRSGVTWTQQAKLVASDGATDDVFGAFVAISVDTVVIGAPQDDIGANLDQGSAYVFQRSGVSWVEQAKLTAGDSVASDEFGFSVAISGDTIIIGSPGDDSGQGSAYIFTRNGAIWMQQQKLTAVDGEGGDFFGYRVAIDGGTAVIVAINDDIGAIQDQGSAYVFTRNGATWSQQQRLTASDGAADDFFGFAVAISGDTVAIGSPLHDNGAALDQGSAYVYTRSGITWTQQQKLQASDGAASDGFGTGVGISGDTILVGADGDTIGANTAQGSAYFFICNWTEQAQLTAADGAANDNFGFAVAISGDTAVVGSYHDDVGSADRGSAYVFVRTGGTWAQQQQLTASDGAATDLFGSAVAISGDTIVIGAPFDDVGVNADQGSAYVFTRSGITWTEAQKLTASDGAAGDSFGSAVDIFGDTVAIGAPLDDNGANSNQGSAYVFVRSGATFTQQQKLTAADGATGDFLGNAVALNGDTLLVGAPFDDVGANPDQGSAYVFQRTNAVWSQQQKLTASDGAANDQFGRAVALNGDTAVMGARGDDVGVNPDQGSAYVFTRIGITWTQQQKLTSNAGSANDLFGNAVAVSGDMIVVGAFSDTIGANPDQGAAYVFARSGSTWFQLQLLVASDGAASDDFGVAVAISGNTIIVGADLNDVGATIDQGSAYVYYMGCNTAPTIAASGVISRQKGSSATAATIATVSDSEDPIGFLTVSVASAPAGVTFSNIVNTNGVITAQIAAACNAPLGNSTIILRVQDSDGATTTVSMILSITANTAPTLGTYADKVVVESGTTTVTPSVAPSDNGSIVEFTATSPTFSGGLTADLDTGIITIDDARPAGNHVITVTAIDNCGSSRSRAFVLTVSCATILVNPATIPAATAGTFYSQTFTNVGGLGTISFSLSGSLPSGLSFNNASATLSGTPTQVGSFPITVTATDVYSCAGSSSYTLVVNSATAVWNGSISSDWHTAANWTPAIVPDSTTDVLIPSSGVTNEPLIALASSSIKAMTIETGRTLTIRESRQLDTTGDIHTAGAITGPGKLTFDGSLFVQNGAVSLDSVEFVAGDHVLTGGGVFASGIITVLSGATVTLDNPHSVSVIVINSGGVFDATNQTLTLTGAGTPIFNSGTFTATGSTIIYQGSVAQVVTPNIAYNNLTLNNAAGLSLAGDTVVNGQLDLQSDVTTGNFTLTMPATGSSTGTGDVIGNVKRTGFVNGAALSFGNPLNTIRFDAGATPTDVTVNLVKSAPASFTNAVTRTYTITPNGGSNYSATLRLRYKDSELNGNAEATLELWRYNGSAWQSPSGTASRDTTANWVEESGIAAFSPWTVGGPNGPTAVELISFTATAFDDGVSLEWQTGFETDNLGFNLYREENGRRALVNRQLLAGSALRAGSILQAGETYTLWDSSPSLNATYWLEDVDLAGKSTWHGPIYVQKAVSRKQKAVSSSALLSEVGTGELSESGSTPVEAKATMPAMNKAVLLEQSSLAAMPAVKIAVKSEGLYRLTQAELIAAGFSKEIVPNHLQLLVSGKEIPLSVVTGKDGRFDESSYIEFYAQGIDTPATDEHIYWLVQSNQDGKRIASQKGEGAASLSTSFIETIERRDRSIYFAALLNGDKENFFGAVVASQPVEQTINLRHLEAASGQPATLEIALQGVTLQAHRVAVQVGDTTIGMVSFTGQENATEKFNLSPSLLREGANTVHLVAQNGACDVSLVDRIRIAYPHSFTADDDFLRCTVSGRESIRISGFSSPRIRVFDVTDETNVKELLGEIEETKSDGYAISVAATEIGTRRLLALTEARLAKPVSIKTNFASNWRGTANAADFVIITTREFFPTLDSLRLARESEGLRVALVDVEDLYDEFSFGEKSPAAIREFLAYAKANWQLAPRFVLFAGDASYDPKNYLHLGAGDLVPTKLLDTAFLETASDDWFADFNNDGISDLALGRLPARAAAEMSVMVRKILEYDKAQSFDSALLVSDENDGFNFEQASGRVRALLEPRLPVVEIQRGRVDAATAKAQLLEALGRGQKVINYVGHGSQNLWRGNLLTATEATMLTNRDRLPFFVMMTCLNGYFQDAGADSLGEALVKAEQGGAVAVWASTGLTSPDGQALMNQEVYRLLFTSTSKSLTLGEATRQAKAATTDTDIRKTWTLLGDPTLRLR